MIGLHIGLFRLPKTQYGKAYPTPNWQSFLILLNLLIFLDVNEKLFSDSDKAEWVLKFQWNQTSHVILYVTVQTDRQIFIRKATATVAKMF